MTISLMSIQPAPQRRAHVTMSFGGDRQLDAIGTQPALEPDVMLFARGGRSLRRKESTQRK